MNKAAPWSIKGVDFDVRDAAKEAARRDGVSLGDWLNKAIADRAAEIGANAREFDADERLEAIAAQLARLSEKADGDSARQRRREESKRLQDPPPAPSRQRTDAPRYGSESRDEPGLGRAARKNSEIAPGRPLSRESSARSEADGVRRGRLVREGADAEALLEQAVAAFEEQAGRVESRAARAIAKIEASEDQRAGVLAQVGARLAEIEQKLHGGDKDHIKPLQGMIASVHDRLGEIETRLERKDRPADDRSLRAALERLETRIEASSRPTSRPSDEGADESHLRHLDGRLAAILARLNKVEASPPGAGRDEKFARLEKRFDALLARLDHPASAAPAPLKPRIGGAIDEIVSRQRQLDAPLPVRPPSPQLTALLDQRFEALARKIDLSAAQSAAPAPDPVRIDRLQTGIEALSGRIEDMRRDFAAAGANSRSAVEKIARDLTGRVDAALAAPAASAGLDGLEAVRRDIAALSRNLAESAPRAGVNGVEQAMRELAIRVDAARDAAIRAAEGAASIASTRPDPTSFAEIEALGEKVSAMGRVLSDLAPRSQVMSLENAVRALTARIERSRDEGMREALLAPIETLAEDVRRTLANAGASVHFDAVARHLREVEDKIEQLRLSGGDRSDFLQVYDQSEQIRAMIAAAMEKLAPIERLERQVGDLSARLEEVARQTREASSAQAAPLPWGEIEDRLNDLVLRIDRASAPAAPIDDARFDELSRRLDFLHEALAARIENAQSQARAEAPAKTLEPLLRSLTEKLNAKPAPQIGPEAIEALESRIAEISHRLESGDTEAERRLLRAVEQLTDRLTLEGDSEQDERNAREIADLREKTESSDRLAQQTLSAVHETLEKVVDRLALLEEDVNEARGAAIPALAKAPSKIDLDDDDGFLMEPGAGRPGGRQEPAWRGADDDDLDDGDPALGLNGPARGARPAQANYIDIARRALAARTTASSAAKAEPEPKKPAASRVEPGARFVRPLAAGEKGANRRLPAVLLTAVSVLGFGAYEAYRLFDPPPPPMQAVVEPHAEKSQSAAIPPAAEAARTAARSGDAAPAAVPAPAIPASAAPASPQSSAAEPVASPTASAAPAAPAGAFAPKAARSAGLPDPLATGAIGARPNTLSAIQAGAQAAAAKELAEKGDPAAQYDYGVRLAEGRGTAQNQSGAIAWFDKAAAMGLAQAQYRLGAIYEKGVGTARDPKKAQDYYQKAADQGHVRAMHNLAVVLAEGVDGKPDYAAAAQWFRRAADYGVRDSQFNLAILFARGMGVAQNLGQSYVWFAIAARQGDEDATKKRDEIAARLDAASLEAAKKQVADFHAMTPAPAVNDPPAMAPGPAASAAVSTPARRKAI